MIRIFILAMMFLSLSSCNQESIFTYRDGPTQFIVTDIAEREGMKDMATYYVEVIDMNNLSYDSNHGCNLKFWFSDTLGKYRLGQPIHFDKRR